MFQLDAARSILCIVMLGYSSWRDVKTREIDDIIWVVFACLGILLNVFELFSGTLALSALAVSVLFSTTFSFVLGYLGLFGGADFKALVALSILQPYQPRFFKPILGVVSVIYPLTVLSNSALGGASFALVLLVKNVLAATQGSPLFEGLKSEASWKKFIILISGMKVRLDSVRGPPFQYPLEASSNDDGTERSLKLMPDIEDDDAAIEIFMKLRNAGVTEVWVSHTLPFLIFIFFGYISSFILGDIALWTLLRILFP